jgi:hypothetical protein
MAQETPQVPHPIRDIVAMVVKDGGPGEEPALLDPAGLSRIRTELDALIGSDELVDAVDTLLLIADVLAIDQKSETCALRICELVEREEIISALRELNRKKETARAEAVAKSADKFTDFVGADAKKAPKGTDPAPKGSIKVGSLDFPKKL